MNKSAILQLSKPVVCLNTRAKYNSMKEAAEQYYNSWRSYSYISDVCKEKKEHYKRVVWRFEDDYSKLTEYEIKKMIDDVSKKEQEKYKTKPKLLYRNTVCDSLTELSKLLTSSTSHYDFRSISALINQYKKLNCSFFKVNTDIGVEYVYFADYYQIFNKHKLVEEEPVECTVEELKVNYEKVFDMELGDMKVVDVLTSKQPVFFKYEGKYYKSMTSIKNQSYDREISKKELLKLMRNKDYELLWETTEADIISSSKNTYFLKNYTLFRNKNDYIDKNVIKVNKDDILVDLEIAW